MVQVLYGFESLLVFINVWTNHEIKFGLRGFKIGILGWKMEFSSRAICHNSPWRVTLLVGASCSLTSCPVSRSRVFFAHLCFELYFGVNMKVLDNCVSFSVALVWLENEFYILSYDENTPRRSWWNLWVNPKLMVCFQTSNLEC